MHPRRLTTVARSRLKALLHQELFYLEPSHKQALRYAAADDQFHQSFIQNGRSLGRDLIFQTVSARKWKITDQKTVYLVKDIGDSLVVIQEKHPLTCRVLECVLYEAKAKFYLSRWRLRQWRLQKAWALKKRWIDKPRKLLVNIGAGAWYVPNWKVLEYQGQWYRYAQSFIDFQHDLTSNRPFPLSDGSVHVFYSEHVLEHLRDEWCEHILREANRCLKTGGGFRIVVPDADLIYDRLLKGDGAFFKSWMDRDNISLAEAFRTLVGHARSPLDEEDFARRLYTLSKEEFLDWCKEGLEYDLKRTGEHINWFNYEKLSRLLGQAGFGHVRRSEAQQSQFPEARGRGFDTRAWYSLHVECVK
jgi:predicted SAM-dependent methyltransferase